MRLVGWEQADCEMYFKTQTLWKIFHFSDFNYRSTYLRTHTHTQLQQSCAMCTARSMHSMLKLVVCTCRSYNVGGCERRTGICLQSFRPASSRMNLSLPGDVNIDKRLLALVHSVWDNVPMHSINMCGGKKTSRIVHSSNRFCR